MLYIHILILLLSEAVGGGICWRRFSLNIAPCARMRALSNSSSMTISSSSSWSPSFSTSSSGGSSAFHLMAMLWRMQQHKMISMAFLTWFLMDLRMGHRRFKIPKMHSEASVLMPESLVDVQVNKLFETHVNHLMLNSLFEGSCSASASG